MTRLVAYLYFNGNCREAMEFYRTSLGGELKLMTVGESPMAGQMPAAMHKNILHASLKNDGIELMASDMMGPEGIRQGNAITLTLVCGSSQEQERMFAMLSAGGKVIHPLKEEFFGTHGDLKDKFGISWALSYEGPKKGA
jgi:PhnB protein